MPRERFREGRGVARRDEPAVLAVDEPVTGRDRTRTADDDGLLERHGLQEDGRRARVRVLPYRKRDHAGLLEPLAHLLEREVDLDRDVGGDVGELARTLRRGDDGEADVGEPPSDLEKQLEVAVRIGADGYDVVAWRPCASVGARLCRHRTGRTTRARFRRAARSTRRCPQPRERCTRCTAAHSERARAYRCSIRVERSCARRSGSPIAV